jgi:hypothetical protein
MTFIEKLACGLEIVHEGPPLIDHGHECWRVHHECAVREIETAMDTLKRRDERIGDLLRRLGDVVR